MEALFSHSTTEPSIFPSNSSWSGDFTDNYLTFVNNIVACLSKFPVQNSSSSPSVHSNLLPSYGQNIDYYLEYMKNANFLTNIQKISNMNGAGSKNSQPLKALESSSAGTSGLRSSSDRQNSECSSSCLVAQGKNQPGKKSSFLIEDLLTPEVKASKEADDARKGCTDEKAGTFIARLLQLSTCGEHAEHAPLDCLQDFRKFICKSEDEKCKLPIFHTCSINKHSQMLSELPYKQTSFQSHAAQTMHGIYRNYLLIYICISLVKNCIILSLKRANLTKFG